MLRTFAMSRVSLPQRTISREKGGAWRTDVPEKEGRDNRDTEAGKQRGKRSEDGGGANAKGVDRKETIKGGRMDDNGICGNKKGEY